MFSGSEFKKTPTLIWIIPTTFESCFLYEKVKARLILLASKITPEVVGILSCASHQNEKCYPSHFYFICIVDVTFIFYFLYEYMEQKSTNRRTKLASGKGKGSSHRQWERKESKGRGDDNEKIMRAEASFANVIL